MICILKILFIFVSASNTQFNDAITETKTKREPTVASTAVILVHRTCIARRDSLPLFNQKSFIMRANDGTISSPELASLAKRNHQKNSFSLVDSYLKMTVPELVSDLIIEMNAKNTAYYFILESDLFKEFKAYCERERS
jgi:hypothetical protein